MKDYFNTTINGVGYYGMHYLATFEGLGLEIRSLDSVKAFLVALADGINMTRFGEPQAFRFGEGVMVGISGFQLIDTSAISLHTNDAHRDLYLDVFSCKDFDPDDVRRITVNTFGQPAAHTHSVILRR